MIRSTMGSIALLVLSLTLLSTLAAPTLAASGGNSANAKLCQKGNWANLAPAEDPSVAFVSEEACVSYSAQGGNIDTVQVTTEDLAVTRCKEEAVAAGFDPAAFNIIAGTAGDDSFTLTGGADLICGFEGDDYVSVGILSIGDVFLGGAGDDEVFEMSGGTFYGGDGVDWVTYLHGGTFYGGAGNDVVSYLYDGTFYGGDGDDWVTYQYGGAFYGGAGNDWVYWPYGGTFID
jgi:hypothetical protein